VDDDRYQEDRTSVHTLQLDPGELRFSLGRHGVDWGGSLALGSTKGEEGQGQEGEGSKAVGISATELDKRTRATKAGLELAGQVGYFAIFDG
jgi:hypothetical protein